MSIYSTKGYDLYDLLLSQSPALKCLSMETVRGLHEFTTGQTRVDNVVELMSGRGEHFKAWSLLYGPVRWLGIDLLARPAEPHPDYAVECYDVLKPFPPSLATDYVADLTLLWFHSIEGPIGIGNRRHRDLTQMFSNARMFGAPTYLDTSGYVLGNDWPYPTSGVVVVPYAHPIRKAMPSGCRQHPMTLHWYCAHDIDWLHGTVKAAYYCELRSESVDTVKTFKPDPYVFRYWTPAEIADAAYAAGFTQVVPYALDANNQIIHGLATLDERPYYSVFALIP